MTFRARPVGSRSSRPDRGGDERRSLLVNVGFIGAIVLSLLILVGYAVWSYWDAHNGTAASVNGVVLTKDDLRARFDVERFRIDYTEARLRELELLGRISEAQAAQQIEFLRQRRETLPLIALGRLVDAELQAQLAAEGGIGVSEADVDARFLEERTITEERHAWLIELTPEDDPETGEPGEDEKAAARKKADEALAAIRAGKPWDDVAKEVSTSSTAPQAGDLGWLDREASLDEPFMAAVFGVAIGEPTAVIEGEDGVYRIGRVTELDPERLDTTYESRLAASGIDLAVYRLAVKADVVRERLDAKIVADLSQASAQRHVLQIFLAETTPVPDGVKVRHILFSPKDDPSGAAELPAGDPAWKVAEDEARAAHEALKHDLSKFDEMARTTSDEGSAKQTGGKQPFYSPTSAIDNLFAAAILAPGLKPDQLLEPLKTSFGWHVIQIIRPYGEGNEVWLRGLRDRILRGADFARLARDQGEGDEARRDGDIDWVAQKVLPDLKEGPIFEATVGGVTEVVVIPGEGAYLWKVLAEEVREPTKEQIATYEANAFSDWYAERYAEADITTVNAAASALGR